MGNDVREDKKPTPLVDTLRKMYPYEADIEKIAQGIKAEIREKLSDYTLPEECNENKNKP